MDDDGTDELKISAPFVFVYQALGLRSIIIMKRTDEDYLRASSFGKGSCQGQRKVCHTL